MVVDFGYGVDMSRAKFKNGAAKYVLDNYATKDILDEFKDFCSEYEELVENGDAEEAFVEDFEDDLSGASGIEGLIVRCINDREFDKSDAFIYDDYCIYYGARIPANDMEKAGILTMENVRYVLAKYLSPILDNELNVEFLTINN